MLKRGFALIVALYMVVMCAVGCQRSSGTADVHVFYYTYSDTYISGVRGALDTALKEMGLSFQDYDSNSNQTTQTEQVQTAITKGAKVILVNLVNTGSDDAAGGIVSMARNAGIPVIFFNREVSDSVISSYDQAVYVGTKAEEAGQLQGDMIGSYLKENFSKVDLNGDGQISYVLFKGEEGNNEAIYRSKYSVENANAILEGAGLSKLKFYDSANTSGYLVDKNGQWSAAAANEYMNTALASYNTKNKNMIELVICNNDGMAQGAITALNGAGFNLGKDSVSVPVFGVDATDAAKELIREGKMTGTVKQDAEGMAKALATLAGNAVSEGTELMANTDEYAIDENVNKIRIAYAPYFG
ncbi:MAG: galactose ABC transporter substrate-binding protein [Ruminococcaceae bacterium]|nr:galactose ABC transporter substrate-binding protein [Oscillospiraceae bacterium]